VGRFSPPLGGDKEIWRKPIWITLKGPFWALKNPPPKNKTLNTKFKEKGLKGGESPFSKKGGKGLSKTGFKKPPFKSFTKGL